MAAPAPVLVSIGLGVGLHITMPNRHWNRIGSQHANIEEGIGRGVGLDVNEALILNRWVGLGVQRRSSDEQSFANENEIEG
jgi:hypothetical protein